MHIFMLSFTRNLQKPQCDATEAAAISEALQGLTNWEWDIWKLREVSRGRELQVLGWHCLNRWDLVQNFNIDLEILRNWLQFVEESYEDTSYHNCEPRVECLPPHILVVRERTFRSCKHTFVFEHTLIHIVPTCTCIFYMRARKLHIRTYDKITA